MPKLRKTPSAKTPLDARKRGPIDELWSLCLDRPRQLFIRRALFQVHLFCGLLIGLFFVVMGLSGSAIVFKDQADVLLNPGLLGAKATSQPVDADRMLALAQQVHPGWHSLLLDTGTQPSWAFYLSPTDWSDSAQVRAVYVDPADGHVLGQRGLRQGVMNWLMQFHTSLFAGGRAPVVLAVLASLLIVMVVTGLAIWWPGRQHWRSRLRISSGARWPRKIWDVHNVVGFFSSFSLAMQALTAITLVLPAVVVPVVLSRAPAIRQEIDQFQNPPRSASRATTGPIPSLTTMIKRSLSRHPGTRLESVAFPIASDDPVVVTLGGEHFDDRGEQVQLAFDGNDGRLLSDFDTGQHSLALQAFVLVGPWHYGHIAGVLSRLLWIALGLCPCILFFTAALMWWNRVLSKALVSR